MNESFMIYLSAIAIILIFVMVAVKAIPQHRITNITPYYYIPEGFDATPGQVANSVLKYTNPLASIVGNSSASGLNLAAATSNVHFTSHKSNPLNGDPTAALVTTASNLAIPPESAIIKAAAACEANAYNGIGSCSALGTTPMKQCGFCLKDGVTHSGKQVNGGMYISDADRAAAETAAAAYGTAPVYSPTQVGSTACAPGYFFVAPPACNDGANQLQCELHGTVGKTCGQCLNNPDQYVYLGPQPLIYDARLRLLGEGAVTVSIQRGSTAARVLANNIMMTWNKEIVVPALSIAEGDSLKITVTAPATSSNRGLCGQLEATNGGRILPLDAIIGLPGSPVKRLGSLGSSNFPGITAHPLMLQTSFWMWGNNTTENVFSAQGTIPVTVHDPAFSVDAARCPTGPMIMTAAGQKALATDPCLGGTNTACAQFLWTSGGCTTAGTGYPKTMAAVTALGANNGAIASAVGDLVSVMNTGKHTNGQTATRAQIVSATKSCTGRTLSACDGPFKNTGPQEMDCIKEIYNNPATYFPEYPPCNARGAIAPTKPYTGTNSSIPSLSVDNIGFRFKIAQLGANNSQNSDQQKYNFEQCYGPVIQGDDPKTCPAGTIQV